MAVEEKNAYIYVLAAKQYRREVQGE